MHSRRHRRNSGERARAGQTFIEVVCGMMILIPIALLGIDLMTLVLANSANDTLCKNCARAAANAKDSGSGMAAAVQIVQDFKNSAIIEKVGFDTSKFVYNDGKGAVITETVMLVNLPVVLPGMTPQVLFRARASQPVVGVSVAPV